MKRQRWTNTSKGPRRRRAEGASSPRTPLTLSSFFLPFLPALSPFDRRLPRIDTLISCERFEKNLPPERCREGRGVIFKDLKEE